jgi:hypothetical protein
MDMMPRTRADAMAIASLAVVLATVVSAKVMQAVPTAPLEEHAKTDERFEVAHVKTDERFEVAATITGALPPATLSVEIAADQPTPRTESERPGIFARYQQSLIRPAHDRVVMQYMPPLLRAVLNRAAAHFSAPVLVTSAYRSPAYNRKVRGAWRSMHMVRDGKRGAVDFKVVGVSKGTLYAWAKRQPEVAGIGLYCRSDFIHVDNGTKRSWYWGCGGGGRHYARRRIQMAGAVAGSHDSH